MQTLCFSKKLLGQIKTVCIHKIWVFYYAVQLGIPIQGILHDLSKFSPCELIESAKYYTGNQSSIKNAKADIGYSKAWLHHKGKNKHHYEYWMDRFDFGGYNLMMPFKYAVEEIADYLAAGRTYHKNSFTFQNEYNWWINRIKNPIAMHPALKEYITISLKTMADKNRILTKKELRTIYQNSIRHYQNKVEPWTLGPSEFYSHHRKDIKHDSIT